MNPLVSVVIPCYNQAQYLDEALQSVLNMTYSNWECIIVNDGSLDHTKEIAARWVEKDPRFIYLEKENGGLSSARNFGIKSSKGDYILTLDADDYYHNTFVEKGIVILENNTAVGFVSSWGIRFIGSKQFGEFKPIGKTIKDFLFYNASIGTSLFRKECWQKVGGYDETMKLGYEDWEFYIRVCQQGWEAHIIEEVLFFYRQHQISMRSVAVNKHDSEIRKYIFLKHKDLYIQYYEDFVHNSLINVESLKKENLKIRNKIDFKMGSVLLKPFRALKSIFK
jgi:glycosyltransferase involved in cell wall biosynthesis